MRGDETAKQVAEDFLSKYGDKHTFPIRVIGILCLTSGKSKRFFLYHASYWFVMTVIVCGLISELVWVGETYEY